MKRPIGAFFLHLFETAIEAREIFVKNLRKHEKSAWIAPTY